MNLPATRTPEQIAFDCRVNRIVDAWVSAWHDARLREAEGLTVIRKPQPRDWTNVEWDIETIWDRRPGDPPPDAAMRAAVIREIDAIGSGLERRRAER